MMNARIARRLQKKALARESARYGEHLERIPESAWPPNYRPPNIREVWRSRDYLVQIFAEKDGATRLSICRTALNADGSRWQDRIPWEDLQRLKSECGRGYLDAVEVYPRDCDVVNVANMRHLWVLEQPLPFAWRASPNVPRETREAHP